MLGMEGKNFLVSIFMSKDKGLWKVLAGLFTEALIIRNGGKLGCQTEAWTRPSVRTRDRKPCFPFPARPGLPSLLERQMAEWLSICCRQFWMTNSSHTY